MDEKQAKFSPYALRVARAEAGAIVQPRFSLDQLRVVHRRAEYGGGVALIVERAGETFEFLLDEATRAALVEQLLPPAAEVSVRAFDAARRSGGSAG